MTVLRTDTDAILLVDDEEAVLRSMRRVLQLAGYENVHTCNDSREVLDTVARLRPSVMVLDLMMPHLSGEDVLVRVAEEYSDVQILIVTADQDARSAVRCLRQGAYDYLVKPITTDDLVASVTRARERSILRYESARLREIVARGSGEQPTLEYSEAFEKILTVDRAMHRIFVFLEAISRGSQPVLILGETGTGKELVAQALHRASRRSGTFVPVNVAGLDDNVFSDTLFGHRVGAFTGATTPRKGLIEEAAGGTLFLDEIGDLEEASQVKLLRLLQEREFFPLGSDRPRRLKARIVAATHRNPEDLRQDLYYRLRAYQVRIPPLRARRGDLRLLVEHFTQLAAQDLGRETPPLPVDLELSLMDYPFPGNVRELQALVFEAVARGDGGPLRIHPATAGAVPEDSPDTRGPGGSGSAYEPDTRTSAEIFQDLLTALGSGSQPLARKQWQALERSNLEAALRCAKGKVSGTDGAAERLGLKPSTLESRLKTMAIDARSFRRS